MKFEYEALNVKCLQRRAAEEEARTGKRVTRILLTNHEWFEFVQEWRKREGGGCVSPQFQKFSFPMHRTGFAFPDPRSMDDVVSVVEVVRE